MMLDRDRLSGAYPQMPEMVKARMRSTLIRIHREAAKQPPRRTARRLSFVTTLLLALAAAAAAIAAGAHFGVFDFMAKMFGESGVLPEAQQLVQQNLGRMELAHTTLNVDEAVYDGGALHVVYSITLNDADAPLTQQEVWDPQSAFSRTLAADQALTMCDSFWLNDVEYSMTNGSTGDMMAGENNGELLCYLDIQLASDGIVPDGDFTVRLPVVGGYGVYRTLDFTVQAAEDNRQPMTLFTDTETVTLQSAFLSPVRTYVSLHVEMNADATLRQADDIFCDWAEAELVDARGAKLADLVEVIPQQLVDGRYVEYSYTFLPVDAQEAYLAPTTINEQGEWTVDMTRAIPLQ